MTRQKIITIYCLKDFRTFYSIRKQTNKKRLCYLKQLGSILLNEKKRNMKQQWTLLSDSKTITIKQSNESKIFYKNTYGKTI